MKVYFSFVFLLDVREESRVAEVGFPTWTPVGSVWLLASGLADRLFRSAVHLSIQSKKGIYYYLQVRFIMRALFFMGPISLLFYLFSDT